MRFQVWDVRSGGAVQGLSAHGVLPINLPEVNLLPAHQTILFPLLPTGPRKNTDYKLKGFGPRGAGWLCTDPVPRALHFLALNLTWEAEMGPGERVHPRGAGGPGDRALSQAHRPRQGPGVVSIPEHPPPAAGQHRSPQTGCTVRAKGPENQKTHHRLCVIPSQVCVSIWAGLGEAL